MTKITYINGKYLEHEKAFIHVDDRGNLFSDGVYEVMLVKNNVILDFNEHIERLFNSLQGIKINFIIAADEIYHIIQKLCELNNLSDASIYLQISRGVAARRHAPAEEMTPTIMLTASEFLSLPSWKYKSGVKTITMPDTRWKYRQYKTISLLPNILAAKEAHENNAEEAILIEEDGSITEGSKSNFFIIDKNNTLHTHPNGNRILSGIVAQNVKNIAYSNNIKLVEEPFDLDFVRTYAVESFITSTTKFVIPVVQIDDFKLGDGKVGAITEKIIQLYQTYIAQYINNKSDELSHR